MVNQLMVMLAFLPIITDTFLTFLRRLWRGHHPFQAHYDHYYQRMILAGVPRNRVLALYWTASVLYGCLGLALSTQSLLLN